ncbi:MAG: ribosome maturation factor RimM [Firmicutes bacterium]|nr:ribosome maturation factor RimM [[Eubacterium] siraeum]MCM1488558.1 ribosome maturation factor RimM [Bacillota bacterium]
MKKRYLEAARLTKTVGLKGEMRAQVLCDSADILADFDLFLGEEHVPCTAVSAYPVKNDMCKIRLKGIDTVEQAQKLVGQLLYIDREDAELPEDTWFIADLIGLPVYDLDSGRAYGKVKEILQNGPVDVYLLNTAEGKELLFPAIPQVLKSVDIEGGKILITPLPGLFEDWEEVKGEEKQEGHDYSPTDS